MTETYTKIINCITDTFPNSEAQGINLESKLSDIDGWDSMASMNLLVSLEEVFDKTIPTNFLVGGNKLKSLAQNIEQIVDQ